MELKQGKTNLAANRPMNVTVVAQDDIENPGNLDTIGDSNEKNQLVLEISPEDSSNKPSTSLRGGVSLPLESLEGTIIKEQDGQQYYVVYDVPAAPSILQSEK